jgi:hypothetical protein
LYTGRGKHAKKIFFVKSNPKRFYHRWTRMNTDFMATKKRPSSAVASLRRVDKGHKEFPCRVVAQRRRKPRLYDTDYVFALQLSPIIENSNANCPNRPSQNEYRKRVPVRLHLISVIAKLRAPSRSDPLPLRHAALECVDTSALLKRRRVAAFHSAVGAASVQNHNPNQIQAPSGRHIPMMSLLNEA